MSWEGATLGLCVPFGVMYIRQKVLALYFCFLRYVRRSIYYGGGVAIGKQGFGELSLGDSGMSAKKKRLCLVWASSTLAASLTHVGCGQSHLQEPADMCLANEMSFWLIFYSASFSILAQEAKDSTHWRNGTC